MEVKIKGLVIFITIMCFASISYATKWTATERTTIEGTATFYKPPYVPSACYGHEDHGHFVAGASDSIWENGTACGKFYVVECIGATNLAPNPCKNTTILVRIIDYCPAGCRGTINLSEDAFAKIANLSVGRIKITYLKL